MTDIFDLPFIQQADLYEAAAQRLFGPDWRDREMTDDDKARLTWAINGHNFVRDRARYGGHAVSYRVPEHPFMRPPYDASTVPNMATMDHVTFIAKDEPVYDYFGKRVATRFYVTGNGTIVEDYRQ